MPGLLGNGVQAWLTALTSNESLAQRLAQANVTPYRGRPVFDALSRFDAGLGTYPAAIGNEIRKMDWSYQPHTFQPRS